MREESFDRILAVNLKAPLFLMKLFGQGHVRTPAAEPSST